MPVKKAIAKFSNAIKNMAEKQNIVYQSKYVRYDTFGNVSASNSLNATTVSSNVKVTDDRSATSFNEITNDRPERRAVVNKMKMMLMT